jgi:hypothetical protein
VGADELEQARKSMTQDEYDQEFMCSFNASIKGAYYAKELSKARVEGRIKPYLYDQTKVVYTSRDL